MPTSKRIKVTDLGEDISPDIRSEILDDEEEEEDMEVHGGKHRKLSRAEKSKNAAKTRRDKENIEFTNIIEMLPFPNDELEKLDKSSVVKLTTSYFKMLDFIEKEMKSMSIEDNKDKEVLVSQENKPENNSVSKIPDRTLIQESPLMLEALDGFLILLDRKRRVLFVSRNIEEHLGLSQVQLIGKPIEEFLEEKDIPELRKQFNLKFLSEGKRHKPMETDDMYHQLDEHRMFYLRMLCQYKNNKTKFKGHTLVQWSGRLKMRKTHKANNFATTGLICVCKVMQTNSILEIKMDGNMFMSRHDLGMTFTFCDPRIITLIGYEPSEVIGRTAYQFHNPLDAERVRSCHSNLIVKGSSVSKYYRFVGKNCDWVWMQTRATIIYNTNNKPQYIVCMNYIISEEEGVRVLMEEDKESLSCTGVMDITGNNKPYKPREQTKGDNHDHHSDNGYHSSYSPYSSINASPLSESSFSHRQCESDDCGASVGDTTDDFPMSVVQECASSLDPDANDDVEMIKFIESLEENDSDVVHNGPLMCGNPHWNALNFGQPQNSYSNKKSLQRIKSCPHVSSLLHSDSHELDDQPIEFMCRPSDNNNMMLNNTSYTGNNFEIPKQGLMNIQIGSLNDGNLLGPSTLDESLPKEISDFCMQYAETMADKQAQDIMSQYAQESSYLDLDTGSNQSQPGSTGCLTFSASNQSQPGSTGCPTYSASNQLQPGSTSCPTFSASNQSQPGSTGCQLLDFNQLQSQNSQHSYGNQQTLTNLHSVMPNPQQSLYPTSPQLFYTRNADTPNSYISGSSVSSPQTNYSNLSSPLSVDMNMPSPASDFSNITSPVTQAIQCSVGMNNLSLNSARSPLLHNPTIPASHHQVSYPNQKINGNVVLDRNMLLKLNNNMSQPRNRLVSPKERSNGHSLCNKNGQVVLVQMAPPSNQQKCPKPVTPVTTSYNTSSQNNNSSKGLRNVKSMSELEKMLRGYSPPFLHDKESKRLGSGSAESSCTLLQQMLTGELSGEKYIAMEKQRQLNSAIRTTHP